MPIISEGYASTKFQGGRYGQTQETQTEEAEKKKIEMKANVIEQATVEEIQTTK